MAVPDILAVNDRIRLILAAYPSIGTDLSEGAALATLPAYIVNPLDGVWTPNGRRYLITQSYEIMGLVTLMTDITNLANRLTVYQDAMPVAGAWVTWLNAHPRLRAPNGTTDNGLVMDVGAFTLGGFGPYTYGGQDYAAFRLQLSVVTSTA